MIKNKLQQATTSYNKLQQATTSYNKLRKWNKLSEREQVFVCDLKIIDKYLFFCEGSLK
jgi:hypothetical protein